MMLKQLKINSSLPFQKESQPKSDTFYKKNNSKWIADLNKMLNGKTFIKKKIQEKISGI